MTTWTIIGELGSCDGGAGDRPLLSSADLGEVTGWTPKPEGWCRGSECIPASLLGPIASETAPSAESVAVALGAAYAVDAAHRIAVIGNRADAASSLASGTGPEVTLMGLDGDRHGLFDRSNGKTLIVAFSSWCGCRYDLPGWNALQQELRGHSFDIVAVAIDESVADAAPWAENIDFPVLVDTERTFADTYGLTNVPTIIWLDEQRRVVRSPSREFSDDQFTSIHGVESGPHLAAVRDWVLEGVLPDEPAEIAPLSDEQRQARAEFRLAQELMRRGGRVGARRPDHLAGRHAARGSRPVRLGVLRSLRRLGASARRAGTSRRLVTTPESP